MCPYESQPKLAVEGYYSRLFPPPANPLLAHDEEKLIDLGRAMRYSIEREGTLTPRVGYTYFGQIVGHDLSHDTTPLDGPYPSPEQTPNYRTPFLNLDQIYGGGPAASPELYEGAPGAEVFKIGRTLGHGYLRDLPLGHGNVLIADRRNLDNLIVRQLHVLFLKFHNAAVEQLDRQVPSVRGIDNLGPGTVFERAQRLVRWHYQWIVRHDFLPRVLDAKVWTYPSTDDSPSRKEDRNSIPVEFSLAAYRFGHSMVRNAYGLNCRKKRVELPELMALGHIATPVPDDYVIEWGRFFDGLPASGPVASSSYIDTSIAGPMHDLSAPVLRLCNQTDLSTNRADLPVRTLLRGARAQLPSGQEVAAALLKQGKIRASDSLTEEQLATDTCDHSGTVLRETGLHGNTPLFYYLLKEAELIGLGRTLGPVGSQIVLDVIRRVLRDDRNSYRSVAGRDWNLPLWRFPNGTSKQVNSLIRIIQLVGDTEFLPGCKDTSRELMAHLL
jgi:hypothetical protein